MVYDQRATHAPRCPLHVSTYEDVAMQVCDLRGASCGTEHAKSEAKERRDWQLLAGDFWESAGQHEGGRRGIAPDWGSPVTLRA